MAPSSADEPRALDIHVATKHALAFSQPLSDPQHLVLAVDGSGDAALGKEPAWAFTALALDSVGAMSFRGVAGARVQLDKHAGDCLGAERATNGTSELSALV